MKAKAWIYFSLMSVVVVIAIALLTTTVREAISAQRPDLESTTASSDQTTHDTIRSDPSDVLPQQENSSSVTSRQFIGSRDYRQLEQRLVEMRARRHGESFDPEAVAQAVAKKTAWSPLDKIPTSLPLKPKERNDGRQFVRFDPLKMESLMPGDEFTVTVSRHGTPYLARIDSVEIHDNGRITWNGRLLNQRDDYSLTFTRGEFLTVGGINTPQGHYTLQSHGELGWVASSKLLAQHAPHVNPIVPPKR